MGATKKDRRINAVLSVLLTILCIAWMYPVFMILMNSLKTERAITTTHAFELPNAETFVGLKNYIYGIQEMDFLSSFWYSLVSEHDHLEGNDHAEHAQVVHTLAEHALHAGDIPCAHGAAQQNQCHRRNRDH